MISKALSYHGAKFPAVFLALTFPFLLCSGCDILGLSGPVDQAVVALDDAIEALEGESADWQVVLEETRDKMVDESQSTIRNEISNTLTRAVAAVGAEAKCEVDFLRTRVRQDLIAIRAQLKGEPVPDKEPFFCNPIPPAVDASLVPDRLKWIEFYGYDFDLEQDLQVFLENDGQQVDVTECCLDIPSHYLMTLNLGSGGVQLSPDSKRFILKLNGEEIFTIGISHPAAIAEERPGCKEAEETRLTSEHHPVVKCPDEHVVKGIRCVGGYGCDQVQLLCCPYLRSDEEHIISGGFVGHTSIVDANNSEFKTDLGFVTELNCGANRCQYAGMKVADGPNLKNTGDCYSIANTPPASGPPWEHRCPDDKYMAGLEWENDGHYIRMALYCCRLAD